MKKYRTIMAFIVLIPIILIALILEFNYLRIETTVTTKFIIIFLFNLTALSLLVLIFFVTKNFIKISMEKKRKVVGYKFKTRIVAIFVGLTFIPSALLFIIASGIVSNYVDRWFDPQMQQPLEESLALSKAFYDSERTRTMNKARKVIRGEGFKDNITVSILTHLPDNPSETLKNAFEGREGTEVISQEEGDIIRAVIPEVMLGKVRRVFVAESIVPAGIVKRFDSIRLAQEQYLEMKKLEKPLKLNYLIILAFFTSLIVFMAMWVSLKISKGITEPIGALAKATGDIASGNLDVRIEIERDDEIGTLVESFNHMIVELKESKKSLETAYFDSNRRRVCMESILENIDSGVISLDTDGKILTINSSACRILGIDPSFIFERELDYHFLLTHIGSEEFKRFIRSINLKDIKAVKEQMSIHVQGKKHIIRIFITQLTLPDGQPTGMLVVFDDLTDVIRAQRALTWQDVARRIAHEIKNPLTPIKLSAERILKKWNNKADDLESTIQKSANTIVREVDGLRKLVDEFSRFGKMPEIRKEKIDLRNLFAEVIDLYKDYGDIRISVDIPEDIPPVEVDPQQFKRVIINLFDNAINAMEGRGELTVKLDETGGKKNVLTLEIADTGAGIDDADKDKLFLPYFSKKKDGTGLGLAISHRIIAEHGGTITVADNVPRGARFIIQIPV